MPRGSRCSVSDWSSCLPSRPDLHWSLQFRLTNNHKATTSMATQDAPDDDACPFCQIAKQQTETEILFSVSAARSSSLSSSVVIASSLPTGSRAAVFSWRQTRRRTSFPRRDQDAHRRLQDAADAAHPPGWGTRGGELCRVRLNTWDPPEDGVTEVLHLIESLLKATAAPHKRPQKLSLKGFSPLT